MRLYHYIGPAELACLTEPLPERSEIKGPANVTAWVQVHCRPGERQTWMLTYIIDAQSRLWIADQRSEHVACARGGPIQAAGELTVVLERGRLTECALTNQSTGYCPEPASWTLVQSVLEQLGLPHAGNWAVAYIFRRCPGCLTLNIVKDAWFVCAVCEHALPARWNIEDAG